MMVQTKTLNVGIHKQTNKMEPGFTEELYSILFNRIKCKLSE